MKEIRTFIDAEGHELHGFFDINEETLEISKENVSYKGIFPVMTNMGPLQMTCDFPVGYSLKQCLEEFDTIARETVEDKKKEMQEKSRIITPGQAKKGGIIV